MSLTRLMEVLNSAFCLPRKQPSGGSTRINLLNLMEEILLSEKPGAGLIIRGK